jgi:hypothetical protein
MKTETITNRYNDEFTFTELNDGNIQWVGNFEYARYGFPNDYTNAYKVFSENKDEDSLTLEEFIKEVHRSIYDDDGQHVEHGPIAKGYQTLVTSKIHVIDMVDPSGGPYMSAGMDLMGKTIVEFKSNKDGYLIITK